MKQQQQQQDMWMRYSMPLLYVTATTLNLVSPKFPVFLRNIKLSV